MVLKILPVVNESPRVFPFVGRHMEIKIKLKTSEKRLGVVAVGHMTNVLTAIMCSV